VATIYVSYRGTEQPFVKDVLTRLAPRHTVIVDYMMPAGVDWRSYQLTELRRAEVFLVFLSGDTQGSAFQNSEIGAARFCSTHVDGKLVLPVLIDVVDPPPTIKDLDCLDLSHRDPMASAQEIDDAIARRSRRVRLFISHAHEDRDLASMLVDAITSALAVPEGALMCTSVPGYQLDLGAAAPDVLRRALRSAPCVVGILTPNSLGTEWVLFELGAAWANDGMAIPLLAGGLEDKDIPGPLRGAAGGQLNTPVTVDRLLDQLARELRWARRDDVQARQKQYDLVEYARKKTFDVDAPRQESRSTFAARRARIGNSQGRLLDYITAKIGARPFIPIDELTRQFARMDTPLHYRLEQLRLLGFLRRIETGESGGEPVFGWTLSDRYRRELGV
jgi:hypothetical protein